MKIAIGGLKKNEMEDAIRKASNGQVETIITTDIQGAKMLKKQEVDYYLGACESGGGAAISILIGMIGYSKCCTVAKNGQKINPQSVEKLIQEGKIVFGMAHDTIDQTVPVLIALLIKHHQEQ